MFRSFRIAGLSLLAAVAPVEAARALPVTSGWAQSRGTIATPVYCYDCWHSRWRSHYRFGSYYFYCHSRWRSHYRFGSYGACAYGYCGGGWGGDWSYRPWGYRYRYY
jgi:hypothetical protein